MPKTTIAFALFIGVSLCSADPIQFTNVSVTNCGYACYSSTSVNGAAASVEATVINQGWLDFKTVFSFDILSPADYTFTESASAKYYTDSCQHNGYCFASTVQFTASDGTLNLHGSATAMTNAIRPVVASDSGSYTLALDPGSYTLSEWWNGSGLADINWNQLTADIELSADPISDVPEPRWLGVWLAILGMSGLWARRRERIGKETVN